MINDYSEFLVYQVETMEGIPLCQIPLGGLEDVVKCVLQCNERVVIHLESFEA